MRYISLILFMLLATPTFACVVAWDAPTTHIDGTPLQYPVESYSIYVGPSPDALVDTNVTVTEPRVDCAAVGLGVHDYVAVRAHSRNGVSDLSEALLRLPPGQAKKARVER